MNARARGPRALLALVALLALDGMTGCGEVAYILLEVDAPLAVPAEADGLILRVRNHPDASTSGVELFATDIPLQAGDDFPRRILLQPAGDTPAQLVVEVTATLGNDEVASATALVEWLPGVDNLVTFPTLEPP